MASMTIRDIDEGLMQALTAQAERKGVPVEEEARRLVREGVEPAISEGGAVPGSAWENLQRLKAEIGGGIDFEIELPDRKEWKMRPIDFGE